MNPHNKSSISKDFPVLIIGAGPAGLMLGHWLYHYDIPFHLFEKKKTTHTHSRAIGIHPVSLTLFDKLGLLEPFIRAGKRIERGSGYLGQEHIGTLDFTDLPFSHPYILTLPQYKTEQILRDHLAERVGDCLHFNTALTTFTQSAKKVEAVFTPTNVRSKSASTFSGSFLIGCDGRNSFVRKHSKLTWRGASYPDTYMMGDFQNENPSDEVASIFIHSDGVVESFALPDRCRRWVVKTDHDPDNSGSIDLLSTYVKERTGHELQTKNCVQSSSFGAERYLASSLYHKRVILVGDAAHIVSPIGGQGMNLGWLGAALLAEQLHRIVDGESIEQSLSRYSQRQTTRARKAIHRAAFNMRLGRPFGYTMPKRLLLHMMMNTPLRSITKRLFTMYGLDRWPI